jgi:hypothetical protein
MSDCSARPDWRRAYLNHTIAEAGGLGSPVRRRDARSAANLLPAARTAPLLRLLPLPALFRMITPT